MKRASRSARWANARKTDIISAAGKVGVRPIDSAIRAVQDNTIAALLVWRNRFVSVGPPMVEDPRMQTRYNKIWEDIEKLKRPTTRPECNVRRSCWIKETKILLNRTRRDHLLRCCAMRDHPRPGVLVPALRFAREGQMVWSSSKSGQCIGVASKTTSGAMKMVKNPVHRIPRLSDDLAVIPAWGVVRACGSNGFPPTARECEVLQDKRPVAPRTAPELALYDMKKMKDDAVHRGRLGVNVETAGCTAHPPDKFKALLAERPSAADYEMAGWDFLV